MSVAMNEQETVIRFGRDFEECEIYTSDTTDIVNIGLHFILKNVRPYAAPCSEA